MSTTDLNVLKARTYLATSANNTNIALTERLVADMWQNALVSVVDPIQATSFNPDLTSPEVSS